MYCIRLVTLVVTIAGVVNKANTVLLVRVVAIKLFM